LSSEPFGGQLKVIEDVPAAIRARLKKGWTQAALARRVGATAQHRALGGRKL
jgi:ribosome-binding protein aMBF1 (putative translation factor)